MKETALIQDVVQAILSEMVTPTVTKERATAQYARFVVAPLERGYGVTLGNALRRVLLSSLPGAAVTSMRINNIPHEFTTVPGVREDVLQIMGQVKQLRIKLAPGVEKAQMYLEVEGEGVVTAADLVVPPEAEIINPELYLFTIDDPDARIDMTLTVERGRGFSPAEDRRKKMGINELAVDALFSPVRKVNFEVLPERVGMRANYDRLILDIWTDGTWAPEEALQAACQILSAHFLRVAGITQGVPTMTEREEEEEETELDRRVYKTPIEALDLSTRVVNALRRAGYLTIGEVLEQLRRNPQSLKSIRNFGDKSLQELLDKLVEHGYLSADERPQ